MATHAVVWIDHKEAHVFQVRPDSSGEVTILAPRRVYQHARGHCDPVRRPDDARRYFDEVAVAVKGVDEVLVIGPSTAKHEFTRHLDDHRREIRDNVVGVEPVDHPTDAQVVAYARKYFKRVDRLNPV